METAIVRPSCSGVYPIADAAVLIRATLPSRTKCRTSLSTQHLYRWVHEGLSGHYLTGLRGENVALTFLDLVTMRLIAVFRSHGAKPSEIRIAHEELQRYTGLSHPFATEPIWEEGPDIFLKVDGIPFAVGRYWQRALGFIEKRIKPVHNLVFTPDKLVESWQPEPNILLHPSISFGEPCIKATRIPTEVLWALHRAGDSPASISQAYDVPLGQVKAVIAWEEKLERLAA